jgi:hypothetical protein
VAHRLALEDVHVGLLPPRRGQPRGHLRLLVRVQGRALAITTVAFIGLLYIFLKPKAPLYIPLDTFVAQYQTRLWARAGGRRFSLRRYS